MPPTASKYRQADVVEKAAAEGGPSRLTAEQVKQIAEKREEALRRRKARALDRAEAEGKPGVSGRSSGSSGGPLQSSSSSSASSSAAASGVEMGAGVGPDLELGIRPRARLCP